MLHCAASVTYMQNERDANMQYRRRFVITATLASAVGGTWSGAFFLPRAPNNKYRSINVPIIGIHSLYIIKYNITSHLC